ncbi:MAG: hypothetical protein J7641_03475 [Cyanobacteria bacterium SID2]|nr:hypothetical protein [Cyanobacteria bacterium SID2]MBP0002863.1 hypothetical protein [Cyanobacteria bacterium SBC]
MADVQGTLNAELLEGTLDFDMIAAFEGDDTLLGLDGDDSLVGGEQNDVIFGDRGTDTLDGGSGADTLVGGAGAGIPVFNAGERDFIFGGDGDDVIFGNEGIDVIDGGAGDDVIYGGKDDDEISGGEGDDFIYGDRGADVLSGGGGADVFLIQSINYSYSVTISPSEEEQADTIVDFEDGIDIVEIVLPPIEPSPDEIDNEPLDERDRLGIESGTGNNEGDTLIYDSLTGEMLLVFVDVSIDLIDESDFRILGAGDVQVTLRWASQDDLDLAVTDPTGERVDFINRSVSSGGELDVDANAACTNLTPSPAENIFWFDEAAPAGDYVAEVNLYSRCATASGVIPFEISIATDSSVSTFVDAVDSSNPTLEFPFSVS